MEPGVDDVEILEVSIRSPHRSEGRFDPNADELHDREFQSAPPTEVRGDFHLFDEIALVRCVSIRSPHRSEGRFT